MPVLSDYYTPTPVAPPPTPEPVSQDPAPAPAPVEPAPPPVQPAAPPPQPSGQVVLSPGSGQAPAPSQPTPQAPPPEQPGRIVLSPGAGQTAPTPTPPPAPPVDTGKATDAIGATASGATGDIGGTIIRAAKGLPENVQAATGAGKDLSRTYRPASRDVPGIGGQSAPGESVIDRARAGSDAELQKVLSGDVGNIGNLIGSVKDVGLAHLEQHGGDASPERMNQIQWTAERALDEALHGDPFYSKPDADAIERMSWNSYFSSIGFADAIREDPETYQRAMNEGFQDANGANYAPGGRAMWEYFQSGRPGLARGLSDLSMAPLSAAADAAATVLSAGGSALTTEAVEQAGRGLGRQAGKEMAGRVLTGAGRTIDAAATMGLSEAVPATLGAVRKGYNALPWAARQTADATAAAEASALQEAATSVLSDVRTAQGVPGVPTVATPSYVTRPTADKSILRVALPAEGANPPVDIAYKVNKDGSAAGVYDVVVPGPTDRWRPVTPADAEQLLTLWQRLPNADRQQVRQAWFPTLSRLETSPGEPFIEHAAEKLYDRAGNLIADTGRSGEGYQRELTDLRSSMLADGHPNDILGDFTRSWEKTLTDGMLHPLTRRSLAEHRLQTMKDVLAGLPASFRTPEVQRRIREMEALLPKDAPKTVGTGLRWRKMTTTGPDGAPVSTGTLASQSARERMWLREKAIEPPASFRKTGLKAGRLGSSGAALIFDRKPPATASMEYQNAYTTYLDLMQFRVTNPPTARLELDNIKDEINGLRKAKPSPATQAREEALREVLDTNGIVPGASGMGADAVVIAIEDYLRRTRPTFPALPGAVTGPPANIYKAGSQDELWGMSLDKKTRDQLDTLIDLNGTQRSAGQRLRTHWEETATAWELAKRQEAGVPLSPADEKALKKTLSTLGQRFPKTSWEKMSGAQFAALPAEQIDRMAASLLKSDLEISQGVRGTTGRMLTPAEKKGLVGGALGVYDKFISLWRSTVLYNVGRGATYPAMQAVGNLATIGIGLATNLEKGGRGLLGMYVNPKEWKRSLAYLQDAEAENLPRAISVRDRVGLGRTDKLGNISRDQIGARTAYNQPDSHWLTKAAGTVLGNQKIKDIADTFDLRLRLSAYTSMFEPAYARLKKDLPAMADVRFQRMAANRGVPIPLSRDQIGMALATLSRDTDGYFSQTQLRQALYEAAGGSSAPNRAQVWDMADRIGRDYKEELRKLDEVALAESERLAFAGGETNLNAAMKRMFMFTWWVGNASQLYLTEAAKSPVQMLMWSRALDAADYNQQTGTDPRYRFFREFAATPAGYTLSLNPMGLLGGYLLGTTADPSDERQVQTKLGEILGGGWVGDNLILSPAIQSGLFALGALGRDARTPDTFGINKIEQEIVNTLNLVNHHLIQFSSTPGGGKAKIEYPGVSQGVINRIAQLISGKLPGTQQVAGFDPTASSDAQISYLVADLLQQENPDLDPNDPTDADTLERGVNLAMADHDSPLYQKALGMWVDGLYESGVGAGQGNAALDVIGGIARRYLSPLPISAQPTFRVERNERRGRDKLREDGSTVLSPEAEATEFDKRIGGTATKSADGRDLALVRDEAAGDPQTRAVRDVANAIRYDKVGDITATFADLGITTLRVQGYDFTAEQIASLPEEDRTTLMNAWINDTGARPLMDAYYANRDKQLRADKAFADAEGLSKYAVQYPGGVDRFVDDTAQINPNYQTFINGYAYIGGGQVYLPELRVTNHDLWAQAVTQFDQARSVIAGVKDSRYGLDIDPKYAGVVAGSDVPVGAWLIAQNDAAAAGADSDYTATMRDTFEQYTTVSEALDRYDTQVGNQPGTTRAAFTQAILNGALDSADDKTYALPRGIHDWLKGQGVSDYFASTTTLKNYLTWQLAQPSGADASIDAYNQSYLAEKARAEVPLIAERLATGAVPPLDAQGNRVVQAPYDPTGGLFLQDGAVMRGTRPGMQTIAAPVVLGTQPGMSDGYQVPAGMPVQTGQRMNGSDGSVWVYVTSGGGVAGWVNLAALAPAA